MGRGFPSMTALLGLLAVAGFQNREKIAEMLKEAGAGNPSVPGRRDRQDGSGGLLGSLSGSTPGSPGAQSGSLGGLLGSLSAGGAGGLLGGALSELLESFQQHGRGDVAESWIGTGSNKQIASDDLEYAIGPEILATLSQQTGLSREELLSKLSTTLPEAVDRYTPDGRIPDATGASRA